MSGQRLSVVLRYGVDADRAFHLNRSLVFPMLRMQPNKTQNNLRQRFEVNIPAMVTIGDQTLLNERVSDITFNGIMTVHSSFGYIRNRKEVENAIQLTRTLYPSPNNDYYCEEYSFTNAGEHPVTMRVPEWKVTYNTPEEAGVYGAYTIEASLSKNGTFTVEPGGKLEFYAIFSGRKAIIAPSPRSLAPCQVPTPSEIIELGIGRYSSFINRAKWRKEFKADSLPISYPR